MSLGGGRSARVPGCRTHSRDGYRRESSSGHTTGWCVHQQTFSLQLIAAALIVQELVYCARACGSWGGLECAGEHHLFNTGPGVIFWLEIVRLKNDNQHWHTSTWCCSGECWLLCRGSQCHRTHQVNCHVVFLYAADRGEQGCNQTPVVVSAGSEIVLCDGGGGREIVIAKEGFDDIVVWNPWVDKAKKFVDFGDEEYNSMLCIEPANAAKYVAGETVAVTAGETWTASQSVYVRQL